MSCAYRTHRYRASVTPHVTPQPASVSWKHPTGHTQHPIPLHPPVVRPKRQAVLASTDDAPIPVSLVQYLWSQWHQAPPEDRESVARCVANLMRSPRWPWDVTVLPDPPDPQHPFVFERAGRPTIGMPIAMLQTIWKQVLADVDQYFSTMPPIMHRFVSITDPSLWQWFWQECCVRWDRAPQTKRRLLQRELYGYLSPRRLPKIAHEIRRLLRSNAADDRYMALTVLTRWLESPDHETRTVAAQMLHGRPHVVAAIVRSHPYDDAIHTMLDRLVPVTLTATRPEDRDAWVTTLWTLVTDPTLDKRRRQMIADVLERMIDDPMVVSVVQTLLRTGLSAQRIMSEPVWDPLLATLIRTVYADEVLRMIEQALATVRTTTETDRDPIVRRFDPILAAGWGNGHDQRILQIIDSVPGPHWEAVLTEGITASVGEMVCDRIQSWFPPDQAMAMIMDHIKTREVREDWPLEPLPAHLIPWVGEAARSHPNRLRPDTIRRLWLADPKRAWNATQAMLDSGHPFVPERAIAAMDAGWGTGHDEIIAQTLRLTILDHQRDQFIAEDGIATAVAGIGRAAPPLIASLLTALAMKGNGTVQHALTRDLHRGWGRGQDDLVMRVVAIIAERYASELIWKGVHAPLAPAWDHLPSHVVVSLVDWLLTHGMNRLLNEANSEDGVGMGSMAEAAIAAYAPGWTHLPTAHMIARIAHHVARLHAHAHTIAPTTRDTLVAAWASVIAAGAEHMSAEDIRALLSPLWTLSPRWCLDGIAQGVCR